MKNTKIIVLFLFQIFSVISVYGSINTYKNGEQDKTNYIRLTPSFHQEIVKMAQDFLRYINKKKDKT